MAAITVKSIQPLAGYVVVEPQEAQKQTASGIYLPSSGEEKPQMGTVLSVSKKYTNDQGVVVECPVSVGDVVLYKKWGGNEIKVENKELQVLKFEDLIAVIK